MKHITMKDLREFLTLLIPERYADGEGGWREEWKKGPVIRAALWPLLGQGNKVHYRVVIRAGIDLPLKVGFLWPLCHALKRLVVISSPVLIQYNRFLSMTAREERHA